MLRPTTSLGLALLLLTLVSLSCDAAELRGHTFVEEELATTDTQKAKVAEVDVVEPDGRIMNVFETYMDVAPGGHVPKKEDTPHIVISGVTSAHPLQSLDDQRENQYTTSDPAVNNQDDHPPGQHSAEVAEVDAMTADDKTIDVFDIDTDVASDASTPETKYLFLDEHTYDSKNLQAVVVPESEVEQIPGTQEVKIKGTLPTTDQLEPVHLKISTGEINPEEGPKTVSAGFSLRKAKPNEPIHIAGQGRKLQQSSADSTLLSSSEGALELGISQNPTSTTFSTELNNSNANGISVQNGPLLDTWSDTSTSSTNLNTGTLTNTIILNGGHQFEHDLVLPEGQSLSDIVKTTVGSIG